MGSDLWPIGVCIYVIGTVGEALGANLQRYSFRKEEIKPPAERLTAWKQTPWVTGFFLFIFSGIGMSLSLFFATQTQLAPLQLCLFVNNALFAHFMNEEPFDWKTDGVATAAVMTGVLMCVVVAPKDNHDQTDDEMLELFSAPSFIVFISLTVSFIVGVFLTRRWIWKEAEWDVCKIKTAWKFTVLNLSFGALAGALGGLNLTLTKTTFSLIVGEYKDDGILGILSSPVLWVVSMTLVTTYILQMKSNVDGLAQCSAMIVISTHCVTEEVVAVFGGILYFQDYKQFNTVTWSMLPLGNLIAVVAVVCLGHFRSKIEMAEKLRLRQLEEDEDDSKAIDGDEGAVVPLTPPLNGRARVLSDASDVPLRDFGYFDPADQKLDDVGVENTLEYPSPQPESPPVTPPAEVTETQAEPSPGTETQAEPSPGKTTEEPDVMPSEVPPVPPESPAETSEMSGLDEGQINIEMPNPDLHDITPRSRTSSVITPRSRANSRAAFL